VNQFKNLQAKRKLSKLEGNINTQVKNANKMKCFDCGSEYHLAGSKQCKGKARRGQALEAADESVDPFCALSVNSTNYIFLNEDREELRETIAEVASIPTNTSSDVTSDEEENHELYLAKCQNIDNMLGDSDDDSNRESSNDSNGEENINLLDMI
jgi:hypothetical protein